MAAVLEGPSVRDAAPEAVMARSTAPTPTGHHPVGASIARGALAIVRTQPLTWAASLLTIVLVPRLLGAEAFGEYTVATTIGTVAGFALGLGIPDYLVRRVAQRPRLIERDMGDALFVTMATTVVGALILALVIPLTGFSAIDARLLFVTLIGMLAVPLWGVLLSSLRGRDDHARFAWLQAGNVVAWAVIGLSILFFGADVTTYAAAGAVVSIGSALIAFKISGLRPARPTPSIGVFREFARGGFPFLSCTLTSIVSTSIDRVVLGALVPAAHVGWYAAAGRLVYIPMFVPTLIATPLFSAVSRGSHEPAVLRRAIAESVRALLLLTVPMAAGLFVAAPIIPTTLHWPSDFENSVPLMQLLSLSMPLLALDMLLGTVVMALGREGRWAVVALVAAIFNPLANIVCVPIFEQATGDGGIGAAIVTGLTELVMFGGVMLLIPRQLFDPRTLWEAARIVLAGMASAAVAAILLPIALPLSLIGGAGAYLGATLALKVLHQEDLRQLAARWRN